MDTSSENFSLQQGVLALPWPRDVALREDALTLLRSLPDGCAPAASSTRSTAGCSTAAIRQRRGAAEASLRIAGNERRLYRPVLPRDRAGAAAERLPVASGRHVPPLPGRSPPYRRRPPCVDLIAWDNLRPGNGYRTRRRGDYLLVLQKPPLRAKATWRDHGIPTAGPRRLIAESHPARETGRPDRAADRRRHRAG